ncbi:MAG TPA: DUF4333 domain-containing protein [Mycobacterium sp.]|nr:DUF4333 domain-containing protein [Mycobacterium sp.]
MIQTRGSRFHAVLFVGISVLGLTGCGDGKSTVDADSAQQSVKDAVAKNTDVTVSTVECPSDVEAKVDVTFDCTYTTSKGVDFVAHLTITKVQDKVVLFDITSDRA